MGHLLMGLWLLAQAIAPASVGSRATYRVNLRPDRRDYQLVSPPRPGSYAIVVTGDNPAGKCKLVFTSPLPAGRWALTVRAPSDPAQTFVFSVPVATGASRFLITTTGRARHDFAFHHATSAKEYRFTFTAPVVKKALELTFE